jgi:uncharacterized protein
MPAYDFVPFAPHALLRGGHAQTLAGAYLPEPHLAYQARQERVSLADGDQIVLHDDCPRSWAADGRSALLIHGLAGSHESGYMRRIAHKLNVAGVRAFRMDLRGCGAGAGLARLPYHSGRSEDAAATLEFIARRLPRSPTTLVGFSLGANIALKLLGELAGRPCGNLDSAMAVCPPVDLAACSRRISQGSSRLYDRFFVRLLMRQLELARAISLNENRDQLSRRPRSLWEFDDQFTAVVCGFGSAENYYRVASCAQYVPDIRLPTLILSSRDDPMIPRESLERVLLPSSVQLHVTDHGGHLGFIGRSGVDPDRRWMDWRVVEWVLAQPSCGQHSTCIPGVASRP